MTDTVDGVPVDVRERHGELSRSLDALYAWCHGNLSRANREKDPSGTRDVLDVVEQLAGAWNEGCLGRVAQPA